MIDIKVSLSIIIPGRIMLSKEECLKTTQKAFKDKKGKVHIKDILVEDWDKMDTHSFITNGDKKKGIKPERIIYHTRKCIPARQNINISGEAYSYMIDAASCPEWVKTSMWKRMNKEQRLSSHMDRIAESFNGKVLGLHVFDD